MTKIQGKTITISEGDHGVPIPIAVRTCCQCTEELLDSDELVFTVSKGSRTLVERRKSWGALREDGGAFSLILEQEEAEALTAGLYTWRIRLVRAGAARNTLADGPFWVGVTA